ncbi:MAG: YifB family Mg chelatase-like AAA ATPase [Deltaproteobacteria bacterium]|nr:YifB family Mg chelatase-like AAA ATPase [Deltaproteobacteria bacterium]
MITKVFTGAVTGIDGIMVEVESDINEGIDRFEIVGLPETSVKESKVRVLSALRNCGYDIYNRRIAINLAPADIRKSGTLYDLPIALSILASAGIFPQQALCENLFLGEISFSGNIKPVRGTLPIAMAAKESGCGRIFLPEQNAREAAVVNGIHVHGFRHLSELVEILSGRKEPEDFADDSDRHEEAPAIDLAEVKGQEMVKRAFEITAAGAHNLLMIGPPGSGKSMLAKRIVTILPGMSYPESIETTKIYSVSGLLKRRGLITRRPFRSPHHTISDIAVVGGGTIPKPPEVSLAHNGVLFLDELPEFKRNVLEVLRQPMEDKSVTISRALTSVTYPANFMFIAAMNPCPCGYYGDRTRRCLCSPNEILRYRSRISGPLYDRIDIQIEVPPVPFRDLKKGCAGEESSAVRERVNVAREIQTRRFGEFGIHSNAQMESRQINGFCRIDQTGASLLETAVEKLGLSARAYDRILRVARTIADLDGSDGIKSVHLSEAIQYRILDRNTI